jgi:hypothetical protein
MTPQNGSGLPVARDKAAAPVLQQELLVQFLSKGQSMDYHFLSQKRILNFFFAAG